MLGVGKERRAYAISGRYCPITPWNWSRFGGKIYQVIRHREKIEGPGVKKKKRDPEIPGGGAGNLLVCYTAVFSVVTQRF